MGAEPMSEGNADVPLLNAITQLEDVYRVAAWPKRPGYLAEYPLHVEQMLANLARTDHVERAIGIWPRLPRSHRSQLGRIPNSAACRFSEVGRLDPLIMDVDAIQLHLSAEHPGQIIPAQSEETPVTEPDIEDSHRATSVAGAQRIDAPQDVDVCC
jgi:hypothetical protein